jgi:tRNA dimethylallyltransferase
MPNLIVIAGPTASGKTDLSIKLAEAYNAEIISADARQFYRKMDIGTAKPEPHQLAQVKHHFIDILEPNEDYNAGKFEDEGLQFLTEYFKRKENCIMVGGSGMYLNAITEGFDDLPSTPVAIREKYNQLFTQQGIEHLQQLLKKADPDYYEEVDLNNKQRVQRALEAIEVSGSAFSKLRTKQSQQRPFSIFKVLLNPPREDLYKRINHRVDTMLESGLLAEVKSLYNFKSCNALKTVGYQELFDFLDGKRSFDEAVDKIKQHTRNYAKRQNTWFKKQDGYSTFQSNEFDAIKRHLDERLNV